MSLSVDGGVDGGADGGGMAGDSNERGRRFLGRAQQQHVIANVFVARSFSPYVKDPATADALFAEAILLFRAARQSGFRDTKEEVKVLCDWGHAIMRHAKRETRSQGLYPGGEPTEALIQHAIGHFRRAHELKPDTPRVYSKALVAWGQALAKQVQLLCAP